MKSTDAAVPITTRTSPPRTDARSMVGPRILKSSDAIRSPMNFSMFSRRPVAVAAAHRHQAGDEEDQVERRKEEHRELEYRPWLDPADDKTDVPSLRYGAITHTGMEMNRTRSPGGF